MTVEREPEPMAPTSFNVDDCLTDSFDNLSLGKFISAVWHEKWKLWYGNIIVLASKRKEEKILIYILAYLPKFPFFNSLWCKYLKYLFEMMF